MQKIRLGDWTIDAIFEDRGAFISPFDMMPAASADDVERHKAWMTPTWYDAAEEKLILEFQSFILRTPQHTILIDSCIGEDKVRNNPHFHMRKWPWLDNLKALGLTPDDIDIVMCTHLHPDHVGWNTQLHDGRWVPTFPNARYLFERSEYAHWEKESAAGAERIGETFKDSVLPVMEAGQAELVDGDHEVARGIWLEPTPGHSPGHVVVNVEAGGRRAVFAGDLMHHPIQVPHPDWSTCFCWDLTMSSRSRRAFVERHAETDTLIVPVHFAGETAGHIVEHGGETRFRFIDGSRL
jgi:glyoxylase-like metal-dependent hydrolase (beta-lactamase superfamily II)